MNTNETKPFIIQCIVMKLSEKESLNYLNKKGFKISRQHFYRLKKDIQDSRFDRLTLLAKSQFVDQHLERIDQLELINQEMWSLYRKEKNTFKQVLILEKIAELQTFISPYYHASKHIMEESIQYENKKINPYPLYNSDNPLLSDYKDSLDIFIGKPFWIWDQDKHNEEFLKTVGQCCFNHMIGKPVKNDKEYPIFDFQKLIYDFIENYQDIWILKSRGIGVTTFLIRYLAWKILSSSELDNKSIFIISGTREEHANYIKEKLQELFDKKFPLLKLESKYTEL